MKNNNLLPAVALAIGFAITCVPLVYRIARPPSAPPILEVQVAAQNTPESACRDGFPGKVRPRLGASPLERASIYPAEDFSKDSLFSLPVGEVVMAGHRSNQWIPVCSGLGKGWALSDSIDSTEPVVTVMPAPSVLPLAPSSSK